MRRPKKKFVRREPTEQHKINDKITASEIRLVGEGIEPQVMSLDKALKFADDEGLDLVEISPNAEPPVCKILDYRKFLYTQKKKQKESFQRKSRN